MKIVKKIAISFIIIVLVVVIIKCYTINNEKNDLLDNSEVTSNIDNKENIANIDNNDIANEIEVEFNQNNYWKDNLDNYYNYEIVIKNNSSKSIKKWQLVIKNVNKNLKISQSWNGDFSISNNDILVNNLDYNSKIDKDSKISLGFIITSKEKIELKDYELYQNYNDERKLVATNDINKINEINKIAENNAIAEENKINVTQVGNEAGSPLELHGKLSVKSGKIIDEKNSEFIIQGVSTHSIFDFSQYINYDTFKTLKDDFNVNTIRLAMYSDLNLGYSPELHSKIDSGVEYATQLGLYVILDWHILNDNDPNINKDSAKLFFEEMANKYKDYDNVIYEICNEPNGDVSWDTVKQYALEIIEIIRNFDNDGLIVIGTPDYCKNLEEVQKNPIEKYENLLYSFHFYAGTHNSKIRENLEEAVEKKLPVLVSEFGISEASGSGNIDEEEANTWIKYLRENNIGYICWNLSNKDESSAILKATTSSLSNWSDEELTQTGMWIKKTYNK